MPELSSTLTRRQGCMVVHLLGTPHFPRIDGGILFLEDVGETPYRIEWAHEADNLRAVRLAVFVVEQNIPEELEWDELDAQSMHAIAAAAHGGPIGCGRLLPDGHIGRMAVISDWRGRGVGAALLVRLIELARVRGDARVLLNAQTQAMPFYARFGFAAVGDEYEEAGIPHWTMERTLT